MAGFILYNGKDGERYKYRNTAEGNELRDLARRFPPCLWFEYFLTIEWRELLEL